MVYVSPVINDPTSLSLVGPVVAFEYSEKWTISGGIAVVMIDATFEQVMSVVN